MSDIKYAKGIWPRTVARPIEERVQKAMDLVDSIDFITPRYIEDANCLIPIVRKRIDKLEKLSEPFGGSRSLEIAMKELTKSDHKPRYYDAANAIEKGVEKLVYGKVDPLIRNSVEHRHSDLKVGEMINMITSTTYNISNNVEKYILFELLRNTPEIHEKKTAKTLQNPFRQVMFLYEMGLLPHGHVDVYDSEDNETRQYLVEFPISVSGVLGSWVYGDDKISYTRLWTDNKDKITPIVPPRKITP